jgi:predicted acetyltransferase
VNLELIPATVEQKPILANLLELYAHDFSDFHPLQLGPDGRFGYSKLSLYWSEPDRHPFLAVADGNLAGFALVKQGSEISGNEAIWDLAEFFVVRGYRRRGVGSEMARKLWTRLPGHWEVRVMDANRQAHQFWISSISAFTGNAFYSTQIEVLGVPWRVFSFESKRCT